MKENSRSNSASSANNNDTLKIHDDYASYSTTKNIVPPPQIGALRFNPAKIIEDSVRKNSNNNNNQSRSSTNNDSYYKGYSHFKLAVINFFFLTEFDLR